MVAGGKARSTEKKERNKKRQPVRQKSGKVAENCGGQGSCERSFVNPVSLGFLYHVNSSNNQNCSFVVESCSAMQALQNSSLLGATLR